MSAVAEKPLWDKAPPIGPSHMNVCLFGPPGSGKSTAAATAPGPKIVWVNFDGPNAMVYARKVAAERGVELLEVQIRHDEDPRERIDAALMFTRGDLEVGTIVFDGVAKLRDAVAFGIGGPQPQLQDWARVSAYLRDLVTEVRDMPVCSVWVCHEQIVEDGEKVIVRPEIDAKGRAAEMLMGEVDVVGRTGAYDEDGERKFGAQLVESNGRRAKDRSGALGAWRELDLSEWLEVFKAELATDLSDIPFINDEEAENEAE